MLGYKNAVVFCRTSAVEYLFGPYWAPMWK